VLPKDISVLLGLFLQICFSVFAIVGTEYAKSGMPPGGYAIIILVLFQIGFGFMVISVPFQFAYWAWYRNRFN
jgi:hypothetical protein